jgi:hypothetical protein
MKTRNKTIIAGLAAVLSLGVAAGTAWSQSAQGDANVDNKAKVEHRHKAEGGAQMKAGANADVNGKAGAQMHAQGNAQMKGEGHGGMKADMKGGDKADMKADESGSMKKKHEGSRMQMKSESRMGSHSNTASDSDQSMHMKGDHMKNGEARDHGGRHEKSASVRGGGGVDVRVTTQQRTEIRDVFREHRVRPAEHINFEINVGRRIPHTVHLYRLPPRIVEIVPAYEDYEYFELADGRIAIVDPDTWEIVAIMA